MAIPEYALRESKTVAKYSISFEQLLFMAYNGDYDSVYSHMVRFTPEDRKKNANKYIYFETITGSIKNLAGLKNIHEDLLVHKEKKFLIEILDLFISECINNPHFHDNCINPYLKLQRKLPG